MSIRPGKAKGPSVAPASGGGGGGNVSGTFTANHIPIATAIHTLGDSPLTLVAGVLDIPVEVTVGAITLNHTTGAASVTTLHVTSTSAFDGLITAGLNIAIDPIAGQITTEFLHVTSDSAMDGLLHLGGDLLINVNKFTVDFATGDAVAAGTMDIKGQLTYEKSTVKKIVTPVPAGGGPWTLAIDVSLADFFFAGSGGGGVNTEISNPTNVTGAVGFIQTLTVRIESSANAADTFSFDTAYHFAGGAPVVDWSLPGYYYYSFIYNDNAVQWDCVSFIGPVFP